ncbi:hypothetical protein J7426_23560 [Tropicibacter sp. R16_0]|uniref:hypothetical protein n=1 Tax=Tropicibacter sp. R16_0 TaxID=2821102 RepID=UPI001ADCE3AA|nr:hypothetical protein [Tropicibacter sp. R16_0]MBO9453259.1 hypothetical protein [Tropicibacter sp. R16_0]
MEYKVMRPHQGDKWYDVGDPRDAKPNSVAHLVASGTLVDPSADDGAAQSEGEKSEPTVENKSDTPASNKAQKPENAKTT